MPITDLTPEVEGRAPAGEAPSGNPVFMGGTDGALIRGLRLDANGQVYLANPGGAADQPTFFAVFDRISPAANKYMATLWNGAAGRKVVVQRIWCYNWQVASVSGTGTLLDQELRRITSRTAGTSVTPAPLDTADSLTSGIACDTDSSSVSDATLLGRILATQDEVFIASSGFLIGGRATERGGLIYQRMPGTRGIVVRNGAGLSVKNITSVTSGSTSYVFEFTDEAA